MIISAQHKTNIPIRKILIIQLGDIGDVVWAIPAFWAVKAAYPAAELSVLTRNPNGDLLLADPHINQVYQIGKEGALKDFLQLVKLHLKKFDLFFDLRADERGTIMSYLIHAKIRAALYYPGLKWRNRAFTHLVEPLPGKERIYGAAEQSLIIVRGFGIKEATNIPQIFVTEELKKKTASMLDMEKVESKYGWVSFNPFSRWVYKEWSMEKWRQLALFIWHKYAMPSVIVGSATEYQRAYDLVSEAPSPMYNLAGKTTLSEITSLLQMSRLHIGVDSAAPQIAAAVGTPTLTIYGPSDWRDWAPIGENNKVVLPDMDCSPCHKKGCNGTERSECLETLTLAKVQNAVEQMLNNISPDKS